ncbi:MAG: DNA-3-methyladenine glycosylase family protein [Limisphaerales bacterium]
MSAITSIEMPACRASFAVENYDLAATLTSGQAFRWSPSGNAWEGVIAGHSVRLRQEPAQITAETATPDGDWHWLRHYLQLDIRLEQVLATFPADEPMRNAMAQCRGLRLLRQDPWECLASFICSSSKQIVQIRQIIALLCRRYGSALPVLEGAQPAWSFPSAARLAGVSAAELRECKLGFRAPYLAETAARIAAGELELSRLAQLPLAQAREALVALPGVGLKIADCVLLFAYGFPGAFPLDVWVMRALRRLYFPRRGAKIHRLRHFSQTHFGPYAGYAQQYLFHYMRTKANDPAPAKRKRPSPPRSGTSQTRQKCGSAHIGEAI